MSLQGLVSTWVKLYDVQIWYCQKTKCRWPVHDSISDAFEPIGPRALTWQPGSSAVNVKAK